MERRMASEEAVDRAQTAAAAGRADCEAARASARVASAQVGVAQAQLARTRLTAPFAGVIAEVSGELNEYVTPSPPGIPTPPAVDLIDDSCFYISAPIDEVDAARVRLGDEARVTLDAYGDRDFLGVVRRIAPYVLDLEKQARTVEVEVVIAHPPDDPPLLAGYSADVEIVTAVAEDTLSVPTAAVTPGFEDVSDSVLVLGGDGRLASRDIETGLANWERTEVTAGLAAGEHVVLSADRDGVEAGAVAVAEDAADG
jgi:HlyD family secretion protein